MGSPIEPGSLVSQGYSILNLMTCIIHIHTVLEGFAYPCETRYADFAWVCGTPHLNCSTQASAQLREWENCKFIPFNKMTEEMVLIIIRYANEYSHEANACKLVPLVVLLLYVTCTYCMHIHYIASIIQHDHDSSKSINMSY